MAKIIILLIAISIMFSGCAGVSQAEYNKVVQERDTLQALLSQEGISTRTINGESVTARPPDFDANKALAGLKTNTYQWENSFGYCVALIIENTTEHDLYLTAKMQFFNNAGGLVGVQDINQSAFGQNDKFVLIFQNDEKFDDFKYELDVSPDEYYKSVNKLLSYEITPAKEKIIIAATNTGNEPILFVEYTALFFKGNKIIGYDTGYCSDKDSEIKPGNTEYSEATCYEEFDRAEVYFSGRY